MPSVLDQLRTMTKVVADTGEIDAVKAYEPVDCTTNPSLVLKAFDAPSSRRVLDAEISQGKAAGQKADQIAANLPVALGVELAKIVPGRISTEVEADLSFDVENSVSRAMSIIDAYAERGIPSDRILIKLAATWEGIRAAEILQKNGIDCNLTLIFSLAQAAASADAGAFLISPFVGRITDWFKRSEGVEGYAPEADPGVLSVRSIFDYYKSNGIGTVVMGASFRNTGQIKALAGCDNLTISPDLLEALGRDASDLPRALDPETAETNPRIVDNAASFRLKTALDPMANELLSAGIRGFHADNEKMKKKVSEQISRA